MTITISYLSAGLLLSPSEKAVVCEGEQLELICTTSASFHRWLSLLSLKQGEDHTYSRYVSSEGEANLASSFSVNSTSFNFSRVSHENESPLVSRLLIGPVSNNLNGTKVNCTDAILNNANFTTASTTIIVIRSCKCIHQFNTTTSTTKTY